MKPYHIPISTALTERAWFHNYGSLDNVFIDKNGVINGLRAPVFAPGPLCEGECYGRDNCNPPDPAHCKFLRYYRNQLSSLDFQDIMNRLEKLAYHCKDVLKFNEEPIIILLFHEAPDNPCSERVPVQEWFASYGIEVKEWISQ